MSSYFILMVVRKGRPLKRLFFTITLLTFHFSASVSIGFTHLPLDVRIYIRLHLYWYKKMRCILATITRDFVVVQSIRTCTHSFVWNLSLFSQISVFFLCAFFELSNYRHKKEDEYIINFSNGDSIPMSSSIAYMAIYDLRRPGQNSGPYRRTYAEKW
jgi:hypothetical protein